MASVLLRYLIPDLTFIVLKYSLSTEGYCIVKKTFNDNYKRIFVMLDNKDWIPAIYWTCRDGHMELVKHFEKWINKQQSIGHYYRWGIRGSGYGGQIKIFKYLTISFIKNDLDSFASFWQCGLWGACEGGQIEIVNFILDNYKNYGLTKWPTIISIDDGMSIACCGGYVEIVKLIMKNGATKCCGGKKCIYVERKHFLLNAEN